MLHFLNQKKSNSHKFGVVSGDQPPEMVFEQVENVFVVDVE